jgi:hypothetical protein
MLKDSVLAAFILVAGASLVAAQGPERGKPGGGHPGPAAGPRSAAPQRANPPAPRAAPPQVRVAPPRMTAPQRPAARAPQARPPAAARGNEGAARRQALEQQQRRRAAQQQQRGNERRQAIERQRTSERQAAERRAAEQRRAAQQQRENEGKRQADRQRTLDQQAAERRRAAEQQRAAEQKRAPDRVNPALGPGANRSVAARHEQLRQERVKLSRDQHVRLRQAFTINRDRMTRVHFTRRVGSRIPRSVRLFAVPAAVLAIFPYYRDYRYVVEEDAICIVDPATYEIVDVLDEGIYAPSTGPQVAELTLTDAERALVLDSIPPDFPQAGLRLRLALGAEIPAGVELNEFPPLLLDQVPRLRHYRFVVSQDQLVIVAPQNRGIALVLDR